MLNNNLLLPLSSLNRVGPSISKFLINLVGQDRIFALLLHKPIRVEKILIKPRLFEVQNDSLIIIKATVESHIKPKTTKQPYKVICHTPTGYLTLIFFKIFPSQISKMNIGNEIAVLGHFTKSNGENQIVHPQEILPASQIDLLPKNNVIYSLGTAISQKFLSQKIREALTKISNKNEEWIDDILIKQKNWLSFAESLKALHNPQCDEDLLPTNSARRRLAYDELLAWQIAILLAKGRSKAQKNFIQPKLDLAKNLLSSLPFELTKSQLAAIDEIKSEINSQKKMLRILQGDVGSGKTIVAIISCLHAISQNKQACVLAPTTVLAKQHFQYFSKLLANQNITIELLTSANTKKQKDKIYDNLSRGSTKILISTHAALEDIVQFQNLGLAIIDEQHRFGVIQRLKIVQKGTDVDTLLMSATPIPRSLMMALYGDMDISILGEKPKNRQPIETLIMSAKKTAPIYEAMKRTLSRNEKIYWICPAIEGHATLENQDSEEEITLMNVTKKHQELSDFFGSETVAILHGKMKEKEKTDIMNHFADSNDSIKILVATTVIEVGIDVADATVIIIENAENFGLSQLHQLRGRVGRSAKKSYCILLYGEKFGPRQRERLNILRESNDGFFIAEEDLRLRGSGELIGTKQSGFPEFRIANLMFDSDLLKIANKNAQIILSKDKTLQLPQNQKYQDLLKLFNYDDCLKIITSG